MGQLQSPACGSHASPSIVPPPACGLVTARARRPPAAVGKELAAQAPELISREAVRALEVRGREVGGGDWWRRPEAVEAAAGASSGMPGCKLI